MFWFFLFACATSEVEEKNNEECERAENFESCFTEKWRNAWTSCGLEGNCEENRPWTTHYESGDGTMEIDCEENTEPTYGECLGVVENASCEELEDAAKTDNTNGPWIDECVTRSCV